MLETGDSVKKIFQQVLLFALICTLVLLLTGGLAVVRGIGAAWDPGTDLSAVRYGHTSVVLDKKMWVIGGDVGSGTGFNNVWYSTDGVLRDGVSVPWTPVIPIGDTFSARFGHTSVVFDKKMWVIGGYGNAELFNDVWYSTDGVTWTPATLNALFSDRMYHTSVVFDVDDDVSGEKMWVIGGDDGSYTGFNKVYYSENGVDWTQAPAPLNPANLFSARYSHTSVVYNNKMWVIGGTYDDGDTVYLNDVWYSENGVDWTQAPAPADPDDLFSPRFGHTSVVFEEKMWVIGGRGDSGVLNDVWYSTDGVTWTWANNPVEFPDAEPFTACVYHTSVVFDKFGTGFSRMWVIGGYSLDEDDNPVYLNDIWHSNTISDPNNVVQLIGLVIAQQVSSDTSGTGPASKEPAAQGPASLTVTGAITAELPVNNQGVVTQATELQAPDGLATVSIGQGVVALDLAGAPVASVSIDTMAPSDMPDVPQGGAVSFAGVAYELGPNGAQFSPAISITFTAPPGQVGQDYTVRSYDHVTGTWQDLPTSYDPQTGTVTAEVSHFCCFALFTKTVTTAPAITATPATPAPKQLIPTTIAPPSPTIATTFMGIILWVVNLVISNPIMFAGIVILAVGIVLIVRKQRRDRLKYRP